MTLFRTLGPSAEPVTLADAKEHLRLTHDGEDNLLLGLIRAAREEVERATGLALLEQSWRLALDSWPSGNSAVLQVHPVRAILSVTVFGTEGEGTALDAADYEADLQSRPARIHFRGEPGLLRAFNGIEIDFTAGFGEAGADVPDILKHAMLKLVAHWFEFRASFAAGDQPVSWPTGYDRLIAGYRSRRL